jgi:hypothetical protein
MPLTNIIEKNEIHLCPIHFSISITVFGIIKQKRFYAALPQNSRSVGLITTSFYIGCPWPFVPPILRVYTK